MKTVIKRRGDFVSLTNHGTGSCAFHISKISVLFNKPDNEVILTIDGHKEIYPINTSDMEPQEIYEKILEEISGE